MDDGMRRLTAESIPIFSEGIGLVLFRWSALRTAVENQWGGRDSRFKADQLAADLLTWFTQSREPLYIDDLEAILDDGMFSFNVEVDDGSVEEVAENLMVMHEECLKGNFSTIEHLREANRRQAANPHVAQNSEVATPSINALPYLISHRARVEQVPAASVSKPRNPFPLVLAWRCLLSCTSHQQKTVLSKIPVPKSFPPFSHLAYRSILVQSNIVYPRKGQPKTLTIVDDDDDEDDEEDISSNMNLDIPRSESNVNPVNRSVNVPPPTVASEADDGWTTVSNRRNRGRRN
ncbi:hypothetical protein RIF29_27786 [Crotalaria pallida]|uniref:Pre-rRNA-processing protein TSR2 n=1 Tax=Crotalaria pallida TaxID=3830 RepID=A0AAN9HZ30_CROPI